jgi:hypothetical protein
MTSRTTWPLAPDTSAAAIPTVSPDTRLVLHAIAARAGPPLYPYPLGDPRGVRPPSPEIERPVTTEDA